MLRTTMALFITLAMTGCAMEPGEDVDTTASESQTTQGLTRGEATSVMQMPSAAEVDYCGNSRAQKKQGIHVPEIGGGGPTMPAPVGPIQ